MIELLISFSIACALAFLLFTRIETLLVYFQQEEYDFRRFLSIYSETRLYDIAGTLCLGFFYLGGYLYAGSEASALVACGAILLISMHEKRYEYKKPLVNTQRVQRLRKLSRLIIVLLLTVILAFQFAAIIFLQMVVFIIPLANFLLSFYQAKVNQKYISEATNKLGDFSGIRVGITGSFGKTTVKHILANALEESGHVFYSKGSINTILGLTRHIRKRLQPGHKYFIAEMGAYNIGSIKSLCEFVKPTFGIISSIGDAHSERFGDIKQTAKAKSELAEWVCQQGDTLVTTEDVMKFEPLSTLHNKFPEKFIICGYGDNCDVQIMNEALISGKYSVELRLNKSHLENVFISIPLLGKHNVMNTSLVIGLISKLVPDAIKQMPNTIRHTPQVQHRLQLKQDTSIGPRVLDDAYNSNEIGFLSAVEVLNKLAQEKKGKSILVTPGIAELGDKHAKVHKKLGKICSEKCDIIYVINSGRIPEFVEGLNESSKVDIRLHKTLNSARANINESNFTNNDVVLYENDLPDILEGKRLL